jgi:hypothetical protein
MRKMASFNHEINFIGLNRAQIVLSGTGDSHSVEITVMEQVLLDERETLAQTKERIRQAAKVYLSRAADSL